MAYKNLVFSGGGILGTAYLGLLDYLYQHNLILQVERVAGASAGAITACLLCFNLPFDALKTVANSLDYSQVPGKDDVNSTLDIRERKIFDKVFDNVDCVYRLIKKFGWYSSSYFYSWIKEQIALQFDATKKAPPYTFADFQDESLHLNMQPFKDLYIVGTDITKGTSTVFSYESTPYMEVAEAVRISMSIPLYFEAIKSTCESASPKSTPRVYSDGGLMYNYPINLFDQEFPPEETIGALFYSTRPPSPVNNLLDFITNVVSCTSIIQFQSYLNNPLAISRSIKINTGDVSAVNFNIKPNDETYLFLYEQGYYAAEAFFLLEST